MRVRVSRAVAVVVNPSVKSQKSCHNRGSGAEIGSQGVVRSYYRITRLELEIEVRTYYRVSVGSRGWVPCQESSCHVERLNL